MSQTVKAQDDRDALPLWRQPLARSLYKTKNVPECRYMQLATVTKDGMPKNRTVVFRGFDDMHRIIIISDSRMDKWNEISQNKWIALCWYFSTTREQYRIEGRAELIIDPEHEYEHQRVHHWQQLSAPAKRQFLWGEPKSKREPGDNLQVDKHLLNAGPPDHFGLIVVDVRSVDYLNLKGNPQDRTLYRKSSTQWRATPVIP
ncbi:pyridoxamine 5'-phosphate oxidase family protein [Alteromonas facilis]|uniref:pyridoxamine 5'-phosphate oxidase family protein n=1 Tax=Alteromonas facilis TaxID=2048004 RepID=UPI000C2940A6|nr:pyridoxamine 5'-phosphate oxidase family protein [Alteromonas facilis]